ncbi:VOC family protein, partial [Immundisolibacter sp.]|uniref:VOC family protein n=1 Tax=Immundisolibacter sp. TaxID=1934948 RepID=UPI003F861107
MAVSRIGYISLYVTDLEAARRHYVEVVGLRETARDGAGRLYLQAADNQDHHCLILTQAPHAGLDHVTFKVGEV